MRRAPAPQPSYRLIPSCFPPIGLFDTVATAADLEAAMELAGWTNDRLVEERLYRLARTEWVFGRTNSSIVMASFLHVAPSGMRFNGSELGAWYSAAKLTTAIIEVAHHMRREAVATGIARLARTFRTYMARLEGSFVDISGEKETMADIYDHTSYAASQRFGEEMRATGENGILFDSLRHEGGINAVAFRPSQILEVTQADHYEITVEASSRRIEARKLPA
ncbi:RES domain protein [Brucella sp. NF 2653]|uniref:RES family NAD+ phosphorylase n=1 Tax=unclassified Brucella TaxID=2632610 RepID=UPI0001B48994|nr:MULTISPECIES: RES family NAD+ phosphorylase [unclassified Brucella]EEZ33854.1 RES domain-containing protein [Brucella sp. 83/13]EFM63263.1 RES domain protein [Brucella sp. NF 2653]